jgi:hypothetical protein
MDKQALGVLIPVLAVFFAGLVAVSRTVIGKALARRIGGDFENRPGLLADVDELRAQVALLRGELLETQERLDFTERMITSGRKEA